MSILRCLGPIIHSLQHQLWEATRGLASFLFWFSKILRKSILTFAVLVYKLVTQARAEAPSRFFQH